MVGGLQVVMRCSGKGKHHVTGSLQKRLWCVCVCDYTRPPLVALGELRLTGSPTLVLIPGCLWSGAMAAQLVVALLALASLCAASDLSCKELVRPLVLDSHSPVSMTFSPGCQLRQHRYVVWMVLLFVSVFRFTASGCSTWGRGTRTA